jgi:hypothetical protein
VEVDMKRWAMFVVALAVAMMIAAPASAGPGKARLPKVTGGGVTQNNNSGQPVALLTLGGFQAQATGEGVDDTHDVFGTPLRLFPASGQIQAKSALAIDPSVELGSIHGDVVCMANYGPAQYVDGGGDPAANVWEIRFKVTESSDPAFVGLFGSILVQDNKKVDYQDESFAAQLVFTPTCGLVTYFQLEPMVAGNVTVHK